MRRKDIVPDVIGQGLPEDNRIGTVFPEIFLQRKVFLVVAVAAAAWREDLEPRIALTEMLFKIAFGHQVGRTGGGLDLGIAEQHDDDVAIRISDRLSPVSCRFVQ